MAGLRRLSVTQPPENFPQFSASSVRSSNGYLSSSPATAYLASSYGTQSTHRHEAADVGYHHQTMTNEAMVVITQKEVSEPMSPFTYNPVKGFTADGIDEMEKKAFADGADPAPTTGKAKQSKSDGVGGLKTIGTLSSIMLVANTITGPGVIQIPPAFQSGGYVPAIAMMIFIIVISCISACMMVEAMTYVPGNEHFEARIEFGTLAKYFFNKPMYWVTMILLNINLQAFNIASIIASAQTMDQTLVAIFGRSCGFEFYPHFGRIACAHSFGTDITVFGEGVYILSAGFIVVFMLCLPMGLLNLDDNMWIQWASMFIFTGIIGQWTATMVQTGFTYSRVPAFGSIHKQAGVLGVMIFNYNWGYVVPSWVNEKKKDVSVNFVIWTASLYCTAIYTFMGFLGGWSFHYDHNQDILDAINLATKLVLLCHITLYIFPIPAFLSGVPVNSIVVKYNLLNSKICRKPMANFWGVIFPWIAAIPFYTGSGLSNVITYSSLIVGGLINYVFPMIIYIFALRFHEKEKKAKAAAAAAASPAIIKSRYDGSVAVNTDFDDEFAKYDNDYNDDSSPLIGSRVRGNGAFRSSAAFAGSNSINQAEDENDNNASYEAQKGIIANLRSILGMKPKMVKKNAQPKPYRALPQWKWFNRYAFSIILILITSVLLGISIVDNIIESIKGSN